MEDNILVPNYKVVYLRAILPDPFTSGRSIDCNTPKGLLQVINILDDEFPDYEFVQFFIQKYRIDDYVLLKLK